MTGVFLLLLMHGKCTLSATAVLEPACATSALPAAAGGAPPRRLPRGVVSIVEKFGADPTGKTDSTAALQRAFTASRTDNVTLFVPLGCFRLTDTVTATQPRNGRWQPIVKSTALSPLPLIFSYIF